MSERHDLIADLLMGAALADKHLAGVELETVKELLARAMSTPSIPDWLEWRLQDFKPAHLDVADATSKLALKTKKEKRQLLELIVAVHESDDTWDLAEDAYLREVGEALGLPEKAYADLTIADLELEIIGKGLVPPPLPKS